MKARHTLLWVLAASLVVFAGCGGEIRPVPYDGAYSCAMCRMSVSDVHFAAQVVAPGEEPRFYDDLGCLARALADGAVPEGAVAFVADHRTGEWVKAAAATYTRVDTLATPMGSHLVAHADAASRDLDGDVRGGTPVTAAEALRQPGGRRAK